MGFADSQFTGAARLWKGVGDDKHSWALAWGHDEKGCLVHNGKLKKWTTTNLCQVPTIGFAVDLSSRTIFVIICDGPDKEPELRLAFEGISFSTGLTPAASFFQNAELKFNFGGLKDEPFEFFSKVPELRKRGFVPVARHGQHIIVSPAPDAGTISLVASSGRDHLIFDHANSARTLHASAFLCSAKAAGILLREGKHFYEATIEYVGGEGHSKAFQPHDELVEDDSKAREKVIDLAKLPPGGGRGAIGWAEKCFFGQYDRSEGVGDDRFSWAVSGANLKAGQDNANAGVRVKDQQANRADDEVSKDGADEAASAEETDDKEASARFVELRHNASAQKRRNIEPLRFRATTNSEESKKVEKTAVPRLDGNERDFVWRDGTVIGCAVELTELGAPGSFSAKFRYFINGEPLKCTALEPAELVADVNDGLVPAVTCHANMRVTLNFGERKFEHEQNARGCEAVIRALESSGSVRKSAADKRSKKGLLGSQTGPPVEDRRATQLDFTRSHVALPTLTLPGVVTADDVETDAAMLEWKEGAQLIESLSSGKTRTQLKRFAKGELAEGFLDLKNDLSEENPIKEMRTIVQVLLLCPHARNPKTCVRKISVDANVLLGAAGIQELATLLEVSRCVVAHLVLRRLETGLACPNGVLSESLSSLRSRSACGRGRRNDRRGVCSVDGVPSGRCGSACPSAAV